MASPTENETARPPEGPSTLAVMEGEGAASRLTIERRVRGESLLRPLENAFFRLDRLLGRVLPDALNPFLHTGAIAVNTFLVAAVTGIVLLLWYRPSIHLAFESVAAMSAAPFTSGLVRSLHRYSSDACMFFALVHALRLFLARRFTGPQWLAWITGVAMIGILWFIGWTGYWLVWDERAQHVAVGTARALDVMPIFADPMERSFLVDEGVNSLLFFVVFFFHMLVPLAMGIVLWLHIARLARARFLTRRVLTLWVFGSLLLLSLAYPADNANPAQMTALPQTFSMDWWYLMPVALTDRLGGGALWSLVLVSGAIAFGVPWSLGRQPQPPATVVQQRCNACLKCYNDCPYDAITMIPRTDGNKRHDVRAFVNENKCVSCGVCAGSCDTAGIGVDWFAVSDQRRRFAGWLKQALVAGESPYLAFLCGESAGAGLDVDPESGTCDELPGYLAIKIPCAGWLHPFGIEHTLRYGGAGVLVVSCGPGQCRYREGALWEQMRLEGKREPVLRTGKVQADQVLLLGLDRTRKEELLRRARAFREGRPASAAPERSPALVGLAATVLAAIVAGGLGLVSDLVYAAPRVEGSELVVTFKHPGEISENCRTRSEEELAKLPVHMRTAKVCDRSRASVRLRVDLDDARVVDAVLEPKGIWNDGNSVAIERVPVEPGEHTVRVAIGDTLDVDIWNHVDEKTVTFETSRRRVVTFDRVVGFHWH